MKRSRFTEDQIIGILKEQEAGVPVADLCRKHGVSNASIYKWKARYGGMDVSEARRLKALEDEYARLKKLLADAMLDNSALKDLLGKCMVRPVRARVRDIANDDSSCINVSGLSRVGRCCSQAMMRSAHAVPNKWFGHEARFFAQGLAIDGCTFCSDVKGMWSTTSDCSGSIARRSWPCAAEAPASGHGDTGANVDPDGPQPALVARLRLRPDDRLPALQGADGSRRLHAGMPRPGRRHFAVWTAGGARTRSAHRQAREAGNDRQRQRHRVHLERHPRLRRSDADRLALHRPRQADPDAFIESFNGRPRDELLNETLFPSLPHVRATVASWRADYNLNRPHSRLGWLTPAEYANSFNPRRDLPLRSMASSAPAPVAHPAQMGKTNRQSLRHAG